MKNLVAVLLVSFAISANAQDLNKKIEDQNRHKEVMLNQCTRDGIVNFPEFKESYDANYAAYKTDSTALPAIAKSLKGKKIKIVLGTWCGDSKLQVPHFLKVMDEAKISADNIEYIAVDGQKHAENGLIDGLKITNVPTFIFFDKKGTEVARITERPTETLEKEMLKLLAAPKTK